MGEIKHATVLIKVRFVCGKWRVFSIEGECYQFSQMFNTDYSLLITVKCE